jgi:hypothetical protein
MTDFLESKRIPGSPLDILCSPGRYLSLHSFHPARRREVLALEL